MKRIILAAAACLALSSCTSAPPVSQATSATSAVSKTATATPTATPKPTSRDWIRELVAIGYIPGADGGQWLDERMKEDAQPFCNASLTTYGESARARLAKQTEFESAIVMNARAADPEMELGYFLKVLERFCPARVEAYETVLKLHPELGEPKGRS